MGRGPSAETSLSMWHERAELNDLQCSGVLTEMNVICSGLNIEIVLVVENLYCSAPGPRLKCTALNLLISFQIIMAIPIDLKQFGSGGVVPPEVWKSLVIRHQNPEALPDLCRPYGYTAGPGFAALLGLDGGTGEVKGSRLASVGTRTTLMMEAKVKVSDLWMGAPANLTLVIRVMVSRVK